MSYGSINNICTTTEYGYYNKLDNHKYINLGFQLETITKLRLNSQMETTPTQILFYIKHLHLKRF